MIVVDKEINVIYVEFFGCLMNYKRVMFFEVIVLFLMILFLLYVIGYKK